MSARMKALVTAIAAVAVAHAINAPAMDLPDMKRITEEDKVYFGTKLDKEQLERLQRVINHSALSKEPCAKAAEIQKTLRFLHEITPLFREAATCADISPYARTYSASLTKELLGTRKALTELLPHYRSACAGSKAAASPSN